MSFDVLLCYKFYILCSINHENFIIFYENVSNVITGIIRIHYITTKEWIFQSNENIFKTMNYSWIDGKFFELFQLSITSRKLQCIKKKSSHVSLMERENTALINAREERQAAIWNLYMLHWHEVLIDHNLPKYETCLEHAPKEKILT